MMSVQTYKFPVKPFLSGIAIALFLTLMVVPVNAVAAKTVTKMGAGAINSYKLLGNAQGRGAVQVSMVGPGATASGQSYYQASTYIQGVLSLVVINLDTGAYHTYSSPTSSEQGAWGMAVGPDQNMYIGTLPNAHLLKFNTSSSSLVDLGSVPADPTSGVHQTYIWQLTTSRYNNKVYGCTYPSADLVSYNPLDARPKIVNLGTMDTIGQEQYVARITSPTAGFGSVYRGRDNNVYGSLVSGSNQQYYQLSNGAIIASNDSVPASSTFQLGYNE